MRRSDGPIGLETGRCLTVAALGRPSPARAKAELSPAPPLPPADYRTMHALFGSVVRGEARPDSDVDLLVEFVPGQKSFDRFMALSDLLERLLGYSVELVTIESLSPFIGPHILAEAADVLRAA